MEQAPSDLATSEGAVRGTLPADEKGAPVEEGVPDCSSEGQAGLENEDESTYPAKPRVILVVIALALCSFIVGMDQTIVATAIPYITDEFHALDQVGWYASAYLMASCLCQLLWGKVYKFFPLKRSFLVAILIFEIGSVLCAAAPQSAVLILGRAIAGLGSAGINAGYGVILTRLVPLRTRALYDTWLGGVYSVASVVAPLIGGALTSKVSWRWCFWINLPCGVFSAAAIALSVRLDQGHTQHELPLLAKMREFDIPGATVLISGITCLLLALQWGGIVYPWNSGAIVALLVISGALLLLFVPMQWKSRDSALVPFRILLERNVCCTMLYHVLMGAGITIYEYYLPLWFQAIKGATPLSSGLMLLPLIIGNLVTSLAVGSLITWLGYPQPFLLLGGAIFSVGSGLLTTFRTTTGRARWIIFQALVGAGSGLGLQAALMPAQIILPDQDVAIGLAIENFGFVLGGALFVPIAQAVFLNHLDAALANLSGTNESSLSTAGVTQVLSQVASNERPQAVAAYNNAIVLTFWIATATGVLSFIVALGVNPRVSVKKKRQ